MDAETNESNLESSTLAAGTPALQPPDDWHARNSDAVVSAIYRGWAGIPWAGGIYAMVVAFVGLVSDMSQGNFPSAIAWLICVLPFFIGMLSAIYGGVISYFVFWIFHRTLPGLFCCRTAVAVSGGLAGFLSTFLWIGFLKFFLSSGSEWLMACCFVAGAILFCQIGALWCASPRRKWNRSELELSSSQDGFRFEIKHLFILTLWVSVLLGINQIYGDNFLIVSAIFYVVVQTVFVIVDRFIAVQRIKREQFREA